jgi:hypothetical protein
MLGCSHKVLAGSLQIMTNVPPNIAIHLTRHRRFTPPWACFHVDSQRPGDGKRWADRGLHWWLSANINYCQIKRMQDCSDHDESSGSSRCLVCHSLCLIPSAAVQLLLWVIPAFNKPRALCVDAHSCHMKQRRAGSLSLLSGTSTARLLVDNKLDLCG